MTFNWHELDRDDILYWILPHVLTNQGPDGVEAMSKRTQAFDAVDVKFLINGVEFDGAELLREMYQSMSRSFDRAVAEKVREIADFTELSDGVYEIVKDVRRAVDKKLRSAGIEPLGEDDW